MRKWMELKRRTEEGAVRKLRGYLDVFACSNYTLFHEKWAKCILPAQRGLKQCFSEHRSTKCCNNECILGKSKTGQSATAFSFKASTVAN